MLESAPAYGVLQAFLRLARRARPPSPTSKADDGSGTGTGPIV